jgi:DNA polymerase-1
MSQYKTRPRCSLLALVLEVPEGELERVKAELPGLMCNVAKLDVPLLVEMGVGPNWEQAH